MPQEFVERYNIRVVPTILVFEGKEYRDGVDITRAEFYQRGCRLCAHYRPPPRLLPVISNRSTTRLKARSSHCIPPFRLPPFTRRRTRFRKICGSGHGDRSGLATGRGLAGDRRAEAAAAGANVEEALKVIADVRKRVRVFALLDTLDNLRHSGRISLMRASIGELLQIKPMVEVHESQLIARDQFRTRTKAIPSFIERMKLLGKFERLGVLYTDNIEPAKQVLEALGNHAPADTIVNPITSTVGTHIGLNAVGVTGVFESIE